MSIRERRRVAFHEAGHAVAAWALRIPIHRVSIAPGEGYDGVTAYAENTVARRGKAIMVCLAGANGEAIGEIQGAYELETDLAEAAARSMSDYTRALELVNEIDPDATEVPDRFMYATLKLLEPHQAVVAAVAEALVEYTTLSGRRVRAICKGLLG